MIRVQLNARSITQVRFAISPLFEVFGSLRLYLRPRPGHEGWARRVAAVVAEHDVRLLLDLFSAGWYAPDFITPHPDGHERTVVEELDLVRTASATRIRAEVTAMLTRCPETVRPRPMPPTLGEALRRGERYLAERTADELACYWHHVVAPLWPQLHARLTADIEHQSRIFATRGIAGVFNGLHERISWTNDTLEIVGRRDGDIAWADTIVLVPLGIFPDVLYCGDPSPDDGETRQPVLAYPVARHGIQTRPPDLGAASRLLGTTRALLLADLDRARTTTDLAARQRLTPAAVSYHLSILHAAGLVTKTRHGRHVHYRQTLKATLLIEGDDRWIAS
jgi:DNA-binding transcriptional ArsR family regulator